MNNWKVIILSWSWLSEPSGVKTFNWDEGLWNNEDLDIICNEFTWKKNQDKVNEFYTTLRKSLKNKEINIAHKTISELQIKYWTDKIINITQNIDDFFDRTNTKTLYLHWKLLELKCEACWNIMKLKYDNIINKCNNLKCNSKKWIRPNIVFFNWIAKEYKTLLKIIWDINVNDLFIVIWTSWKIIDIEGIINKINCKKILCNLEDSKFINANCFNKVYKENIKTWIVKIENDINEHLINN